MVSKLGTISTFKGINQRDPRDQMDKGYQDIKETKSKCILTCSYLHISLFSEFSSLPVQHQSTKHSTSLTEKQTLLSAAAAGAEIVNHPDPEFVRLHVEKGEVQLTYLQTMTVYTISSSQKEL